MQRYKTLYESTTVTLYAPHKVSRNSNQYGKILTIMKKKGSPIIRAVDMGDYYQAVEGSHRISVARDLNIPVLIKEVEFNDIIKNHDFEDLPTKTTVVNIIDYLGEGEFVDINNAKFL